jgi:osmoprotectant transport system permease protein
VNARALPWFGFALAALLLGLAFVLFAQQDAWASVLARLFPQQRIVMFERTTLLALARQHVVIVGISMTLILSIGLPLGVWLTRAGGRAFLPLASNLLSAGQAFPPVAVLALALPFFGFGLKPTLIALTAYGLLPVTRNTIAGLQGIPADLKEAALGMGMGPGALFWRVELPLALRTMLAGVRISTIYTIGTATIAPIIGAGGLGVPIIAGLAVGNLALVLEGAVAVALLALLTDFALGRLELLAPDSSQ